MEESDELPSKVGVELSTVVVVKNRCQFCYAFFRDAEKIAEHSERCEFRFSEVFEAFDGNVKFACVVCFDVFKTRAEHARHEQLHKFPGGYPCLICNDIFLNDPECDQHMEEVHKTFNADKCSGYCPSKCNDCGAFFEQKSYLRLHMETKCGKHRSWHCLQCNLLTEQAYKQHMDTQHNEDVVITTKVEDTSHDNETIRPMENVPKADVIFASVDDPLLLELKEEVRTHEDSENTQNTMDESMDEVNESSEEDSSSEKSIKKSESMAGANSGDDERDRASDTANDSSSGIKRIRRRQEANLKCKYCGKTYSLEAFYYKHVRAHGPDGSLLHKCECCPIYFKTKQERNEHTKTLHKHRVTCTICNKVYKNIDSLYSHRQLSHEKREKKINNYFCAKCGASFTNRTYLDAHENSDCGRSPTFKCDDCGRLFMTKFALKNHRIVHSDERKFACDICQIRFKSKYNLKVHASTHSSEKPHKCQHCDKRFADASYLRSHMTLHAAVKRYVCYGCGSRFPTNSALHKHRNTRKDTCALVPIQPPLKSDAKDK